MSVSEQYLQSPLQMEHSCELLLTSELFTFHSERMSEILIEDTRQATDPHVQFILYSVLLNHGRRSANFLRSQKRWQPILPLLMDNITVDVDPDVEDTYFGSTSGTSSGVQRSMAVPIEAKLRSLSVRLLYDVCRVQKLSIEDLEIFSDIFIDYLFDLVEQTRHMQDESFNYSVIKLLVALNEQFMVASLHPHAPRNDVKPHPAHAGHAGHKTPEKIEGQNRILRVLKTRIGSSMTFGENMIFMLNRADRTAEDLCMQLLVLKLLYLLFTSKGMAEYFYTNDLCVLVDVVLREIGNIDEDNESLRHTYLRVLHPLLTKTQLRSMPYKRAQVVRTLELLVENESIRDVDPTTKRLVARCLSGDWCVQFRKTLDVPNRVDSPGLSGVTSPHSVSSVTAMQIDRLRSGSIRGKNYKASRSVENLASSANIGRARGPGQTRNAEVPRQPSADSAGSLPKLATASSPTNAPRRRDRAGSMDGDGMTSNFASLSLHDRKHVVIPDTVPLTAEPIRSPPLSNIRVDAPMSPTDPPDSPMSLISSSSSSTLGSKPRRSAPAPPTKRRKPPAVPAGRVPMSPMSAAASQPSLTSFLPARR
ncbi:uncharacterized protein FIBRA_06672 [Fibroporia radiculosa]|uniref:SPIN90/Ldb17 leucine-rich domain-containing protein n=1 Tax=Fibroporia radiculosa TaxID=599839 RepID=J4HZH2_9APHY|nr:uncharacterized protein FIBRA_06672 [Fibroporia radiculosa]CCM04492.1 predicted protein [Fibroporia radiculosa]